MQILYNRKSIGYSKTTVYFHEKMKRIMISIRLIKKWTGTINLALMI